MTTQPTARCFNRAKLAFILSAVDLTMMSLESLIGAMTETGGRRAPRRPHPRRWHAGFAICAGGGFLPARRWPRTTRSTRCMSTPPPAARTGNRRPTGAEAPAVTGTAALKVHPGSFIRMNVDMVLVPVTVTDPMNRLVTGLEQEDFQVYENNGQQKISKFCQRRCAGVDRHHLRSFRIHDLEADSRARVDFAVHQDGQSRRTSFS